MAANSYVMKRTSNGVPYRLYPDGLVTVELRHLMRFMPTLTFMHPSNDRCDLLNQWNSRAIDKLKDVTSKVFAEIETVQNGDAHEQA